MSEKKNNAIIHHIGLKNFKGYQKADIPLAPITLFFGPNSAGKSTVFQMLYLLKQTLQFAPENVPLLFRCDNGYVDLGSFEDVVHDHDVSREIMINIDRQSFVFKQVSGKLTLDRVEISTPSEYYLAKTYGVPPEPEVTKGMMKALLEAQPECNEISEEMKQASMEVQPEYNEISEEMKQPSMEVQPEYNEISEEMKQALLEVQPEPELTEEMKQALLEVQPEPEEPSQISQFIIQNRSGMGYRFESPSGFYKWAYGLIHKHKDDILWAIAQMNVLCAFNSYLGLEGGHSSQAKADLKKVLLGINRQLLRGGENDDCVNWGEPWSTFSTSNPGIIGFHLGDEFDKRKVVPKKEYLRILEDLKKKGWSNPFECGCHYRVAVDSSEMKNVALRTLFEELKRIIKQIVGDPVYREHLMREQRDVEKETGLLKADFSETELWEVMGIKPDGLGVYIRQFIPDTHADFDKRGDREVENWLQYISATGPVLSAQHGGHDESEASAHMGYADWKGRGNPPRLTRNDRIHDPQHYEDQEARISVPAYELGLGDYPNEYDVNSAKGRGRFLDWLYTQNIPSKRTTQSGISPGNTLRKMIDTVFKPIGPIRMKPRRLYWATGSVSDYVGFLGEWIGGILLNAEYKNEVNKWLVKLTGYEVEREEVGGILPGAYVLMVRDTRRDGAKYVKITDVGFGISQVLPLVAQLVAAKESVITIEQPESQIHPALQAEFADLVVWSMKENKNQVLIETHSEHFMLALKKMIRLQKLEASDLLVNYVKRTKNGSEVTTIPVGDDGQFQQEWPDGFFRERRKLISDAE